MSERPVTRWHVKGSRMYGGKMGRKLYPGMAWLAYGKYGDRIVPGSARHFGSWYEAMDYVNGRIKRLSA